MDIRIEEVSERDRKGGVQPGQPLDFGKDFSDHMFQMTYSPELGWHDAVIKQYENFSLSPATMALHYGQLIFEGLKAYYRDDGKIGFFRARDNLKRINESARRMCMPTVDVEETYEAMCRQIELDRGWVPKDEGSSLYVRPTMMGIDPLIRLKASDTYLFFVICSPVGLYYENGLAPTRIIVEEEYVRAVRGGVGFAKTAANYAASLLPGKLAEAKGYDQVLWLDGVERCYVEEVGSMNIFFKYPDRLVTSELNGSILPGITRDAVIELAKSWGETVSEEKVDINRVVADIKAGEIVEVFGSGTAAVISPVGLLNYRGEDVSVNEEKTGDFTMRMYDELTGIQYGRREDPFGWTTTIG
ncbi:MAG: branched-chain amino acid aminotransferase [Deltaproteobacteria bacterium]|nr:branched-chain amino acid aminotransferase [Deltaproteobacteria bacterium]